MPGDARCKPKSRGPIKVRKEGGTMELHQNGSGKYMYKSLDLIWERVPTNIPHVWIEHIRLNDRDVLIVNDELGGFDRDTQSDTAQYSLIETTFPEVRQGGYRHDGCIEVEDGRIFTKIGNLTV
jgi:hypothetical protein